MNYQVLNEKISLLSRSNYDLKTPSGKLKALSDATNIINEVLKILNPNITGLRYGEDALENILPNNCFPNSKVESWFSQHPVYPDDKLAIRFYESNLCEVKFYWLNDNSTKSRIAAGVMLTPNWEDSETTENDNYRIGIDFFLKKDTSALLMVISYRGNLRVMEFSNRLTHTQVEILNKIEGALTLPTKSSFQKLLWDSLALSEVNKSFYEGIARHFTILSQHLKKLGKPENDAKIFSNRLLGRLMFIWFLRKKRIVANENIYFPEKISDSTEYYNNVLKSLFFAVFNTPIPDRKNIDKKTPFLNGGLFDQRDNDWVSETISFPKDFFNSLYAHLNKYNFTTDESSPDYEQVAIDPEMLGKVFESLLAEQITDSGDQARKAKGAFYTRREIVAYMCKESLRQYLYSCFADKRYNSGVDKLLDTPDYIWETAHTNSRRDLWPFEDKDKIFLRVIGMLDAFRVIDPACGSGAFPMGMLQLLVKTYKRLDTRLDPYETKIKAIQNNIFGVDIEPMAVDISRLRAWLAIIVDDEGNIDPLPNLDFKFICADSLTPLVAVQGLGDDTELFDKLTDLREQFFCAIDPQTKEKCRDKYYKLTQKESNAFSGECANQLKSFDPFKNRKNASFFDSKYMFGVDKFDAVIGNPPYVCTKDISSKDKEKFVEIYDFSDDLYNLFTFRGLMTFKDARKRATLLKDGGSLTFITSKSFWTTQTKKRMRNLLLDNCVSFINDTGNPFADSGVMVDTCIFQVIKNPYSLDHLIRFIDGSKDFNTPIVFDPIKQSVYIHTQNFVIFKPTELNLKIWNKYGEKVKALYDQWWDKIKTSKDIEKNKRALEKYRASLKPGDIALLGCLTEGGQGLATANNGKYIAYRKSSKWAVNVYESRPKKLAEAIQKHPEISDYLNGLSPSEFLAKSSEKKIANTFDRIKEEFGRDIFGQGYIYRLIDDNEIADVDSLTDDEKENGISTNKPFYVPYDKGDKDGNRWYLETPFAIAWSKENVQFLKTDPKARYQGYTFFFKEGLCWSDINTTFLKCRIKQKSINDVKSMSLYGLSTNVPEYYVICLINSTLMSYYVDNYVNNTQTFQINDARQLPIIIPYQKELNKLHDIFKSAIQIKKSSNNLEELQLLQQNLDKIVNEIYSIN